MIASCWIVVTVLLLNGAPIEFRGADGTYTHQEKALYQVREIIKRYHGLTPWIELKDIRLEPVECPAKAPTSKTEEDYE